MSLLPPIALHHNSPHSAVYTHLTCVFSTTLSTAWGQELHLSCLGSWCSSNVWTWLSILPIFVELIDEWLQLASQRQRTVMKMGPPKTMVPAPPVFYREAQRAWKSGSSAVSSFCSSSEVWMLPSHHVWVSASPSIKRRAGRQNIGHPVKFEFQVNNESLSGICMWQYLLFIWNSNLTGHPLFLFTKSGKPTYTWIKIFLTP